MRKLQGSLVVCVLAFSALIARGQDTAREPEATQVKTAVSALNLKKRPSVIVVRRDLSSLSGIVTAITDEEFSITLKAKKGELDFNILYEDVLEISGSGIRLSFAPDPQAAVHGIWADVKGILKYRPIGVVLRNGKEMTGNFGGADDTKLKLVGARIDSVLDIPREMIVRVFGVTDGKAGVKEYTRRGMKGGSEVGAPEALVVMPVATGVGALIGLSKQKKRRVILVFAR